MDVVEWAALEGRPDQLGYTVHLMDRGVDTGPMLRVQPVPIDAEVESLQAYRRRLQPLMAQGLAATTAALLRGEIAPTPQRAADGRQYFTMHKRLVGAADAGMKRGARLP